MKNRAPSTYPHLDILALSKTTNLNKSEKSYGKGISIDSKNFKALHYNKSLNTKLATIFRNIAKETGNDSMLRKVKNLEFCYSNARLHNNVVLSHYCKEKFCFTCSKIRKAKYTNDHSDALNYFKQPQLVTLTVDNVYWEYLSSKLKTMRKAFLQYLNTHRKNVERGKVKKLEYIISVECTHNTNTDQYHPHFHIVVDNKQIAETMLLELKRRLFLPQQINDGEIKSCYNEKEFPNGILSYLVKTLDFDELANRLNEKPLDTLYFKGIFNCLLALSGTKTIMSSRGLPKTTKKESEFKIKETEIQDTSLFIYHKTSNQYIDKISGEILKPIK